LQIKWPVRIGRDRVSDVPRRAVGSRHVPTTPSVLNWRAMVDAFKKRPRHKWSAIRGWINRRNNETVSGTMAVEAFAEAPLEARLVLLLRVHRIEDETLRGIQRCELEHSSILNRAERHA